MKTSSRKISLNTLTLPIMAFLIVGCSQDMSDLHGFIETTKASSIGSVKPVKQFKPYEGFAYSAADLRDPFLSHSDITEDLNESENALHPESDRPKQYLETFPLDTLSMVGTLEQKDNAWGLIKDPKNVVHRVQLGNYMGQNEGRIIKITEVKIYLVEILPDGIGGYIERDASIAIGNE